MLVEPLSLCGNRQYIITAMGQLSYEDGAGLLDAQRHLRTQCTFAQYSPYFTSKGQSLFQSWVLRCRSAKDYEADGQRL